MALTLNTIRAIIIPNMRFAFLLIAIITVSLGISAQGEIDFAELYSKLDSVLDNQQ